MGTPTKIEHGKDAGDHKKRAGPFEKPTGVMEDLEGGAVEILRVPPSLGKFVGKPGDLGEESGWEGGRVIHLELGWDFEISFRIGECDGGAEVGGFVGAGVAWDIEGIETDGEGKRLKFQAEADAGGCIGGGQNGGCTGGDPAGIAGVSIGGAQTGMESRATRAGVGFFRGKGDGFDSGIFFERDEFG